MTNNYRNVPVWLEVLGTSSFLSLLLEGVLLGIDLLTGKEACIMASVSGAGLLLALIICAYRDRH